MGTRPVQHEMLGQTGGPEPWQFCLPHATQRTVSGFQNLGTGVLLLASRGQRQGILLNTLNCTTRDYPAPNVNSGEIVQP